MKNIINFYALIIAPLGAIVLLAADNLISSYLFVSLLLVYSLVYHPYISGLRLIASNKITKKQLWYNFIPTWNWKYFSFLFFNAEINKHKN
jgi:hypothetical protein